MVRSLHRDEIHRHGDINVTSLGKDILLWRIAGLKRDALMMSLSGAELGTLTEGWFRPCQALQNYDSAGSSASVNQIVLMVRSLHRDEFHRHGDINVTSPGKDISLRRIEGLRRDALMMSLSGAELGKLT